MHLDRIIACSTAKTTLEHLCWGISSHIQHDQCSLHKKQHVYCCLRAAHVISGHVRLSCSAANIPDSTNRTARRAPQQLHSIFPHLPSRPMWGGTTETTWHTAAVISYIDPSFQSSKAIETSGCPHIWRTCTKKAPDGAFTYTHLVKTGARQAAACYLYT